MLDYIGGLKIYGVTSFTGKNALKKSNFKQNSCKKVLVYVIGWQAVVFGINSSRIVNRKEIVRGELLPIYNAHTIYPKYHSLPSCYKLIQQA